MIGHTSCLRRLSIFLAKKRGKKEKEKLENDSIINTCIKFARGYGFMPLL